MIDAPGLRVGFAARDRRTVRGSVHPQDQWMGPFGVEAASGECDEIHLGIHSALHRFRRDRKPDGVAESVAQMGEQLIDR